MQQISIDREAMSLYLHNSDSVAAELRAAAANITGAADIEHIERLAADLGQIGAEFAGRIAQVFAGHAEVLGNAAHLVDHYGQTLATLTTSTAATDTDTAAALTRARQAL
jgi:hypothetical protein